MDLFKITRTLATGYSAVPDRVQNAFEDEFAQELIELWKDKKRRGQAYVAYLYSIPVGFCLVEQEGIGKSPTIRGMYVQEKFRGREIGSLLLKSVILDYEKRGIWVNITDGAQKFYFRFGFEIILERKDLPAEAGKQFLACRAPEGQPVSEFAAAAYSVYPK